MGKGGLRVSLLPEVRVLSWRFDGPLFARVTDAEGAPVGAALTLRIGKKETRGATAGPLGLASFPFDADRPRYQLLARATAHRRPPARAASSVASEAASKVASR